MFYLLYKELVSHKLLPGFERESSQEEGIRGLNGNGKKYNKV